MKVARKKRGGETAPGTKTGKQAPPGPTDMIGLLERISAVSLLVQHFTLFEHSGRRFREDVW